MFIQKDNFSKYKGYELKDPSINPKGNSPLRLKNQKNLGDDGDKSPIVRGSKAK